MLYDFYSWNCSWPIQEILVGGFNHLENMKVNGKDDIPYKKVPNHQPEYIAKHMFFPPLGSPSRHPNRSPGAPWAAETARGMGSFIDSIAAAWLLSPPVDYSFCWEMMITDNIRGLYGDTMGYGGFPGKSSITDPCSLGVQLQLCINRYTVALV